MSAEFSLRDRPLTETLAGLQQQIRTHPSDAKLRTFLFQLLAVLGQWDRSLAQLNVAGELDPLAMAMVQTYREALRCEVLRAGVFSGERTPIVFGEPAPWVALLVEALKHVAEGRPEQARTLRERAFEQAPATPGRLWRHPATPGDPLGDGEPIGWVADADSRLGPMMEAIVNGRYWWIPIQHVHRVDFEPPADLRDLVWTPAHFEWTNGGEMVGFVPTRYPGSEASEDDSIRKAARTDWRDLGGDTWVGLGQRLLATDAGECSLLEVRRIVFDLPEGDEGNGG
jgi:type VI secretion system protein ImpE